MIGTDWKSERVWEIRTVCVTWRWYLFQFSTKSVFFLSAKFKIYHRIYHPVEFISRGSIWTEPEDYLKWRFKPLRQKVRESCSLYDHIYIFLYLFLNVLLDLYHIDHWRLFNANSCLWIYFNIYIICKHIFLITFLNKSELFFWFLVLLYNSYNLTSVICLHS